MGEDYPDADYQGVICNSLEIEDMDADESRQASRGGLNLETTMSAPKMVFCNRWRMRWKMHRMERTEGKRTVVVMEEPMMVRSR